jgi:hypothetical protein
MPSCGGQGSFVEAPFVEPPEGPEIPSQEVAAAVVITWNRFNEVQGSFADEYNTL